jgi:hypothetical protein
MPDTLKYSAVSIQRIFFIDIIILFHSYREPIVCIDNSELSQLSVTMHCFRIDTPVRL